MKSKRFFVTLFVLLASLVSLAQTTTRFDKFKNRTEFATNEVPTGILTYTEGGGTPQVSMGVIVAFSCKGRVDGCSPTNGNIELLFVALLSG